jgi:DNA transposition AAA+ family ATPase
MLVTRLREHGVMHDKTTISRILRGRWQVDESGRPRSTPILSEEKLLRLIECLRSGVRSESLQGRVPFVATSVAQAIFDYIDLKRSPGRVNRFGIISGHTGSQKTATYDEYHRQRNHGKTWKFEAPSGGHIGYFLQRMAECSGISAQTSAEKVRAHLRRSIRPDKCIIIDNSQSLYRDGKIIQPVFDFLRELQDETGMCVILSITPTFERALTVGLMSGYFEQFEGRSGGRSKWLRLPEYAPEEDVLQIAQAFGIGQPKAALKKLVAISREPGRIRRLFEDLQDGKRLANIRNEAFLIDHVLAAREEVEL